MTDKAADSGEADDAPQGFWAKVRIWHLVTVVTLMAMVSYIDRASIFHVIDPIKADLRVDDFQMSLVIGFAFIALYSIFAIPAGWVADRWNRKAILFISIFFSGLAAMASGFATTYAQLFAARVALGVAEAALPPAAYSLIRDGVPAKQRGRAFAIYAIGSVWGVALGALAAGTTLAADKAGVFDSIPILSEMRPWQLVLIVPAACCMPIILLLASMREPPRRKAPVELATPETASTYREAFAYLWLNWRMYAPIVASSTIGLLALGGWGAWIYVTVSRQWDLPSATIAKNAGLISLICVPICNLAAGWMMDFFSKGGQKTETYLIVPMILAAIFLVPAMGVLFAPNLSFMWGAWVVMTLTSVSPLAATGTVMTAITPSRLMGKVTSLYFLIANLLGFSLGPTVFATVALMFEGKNAMASALALGFPLLMAVKLGLMLVAARQVRNWRLNPATMRVL
jgi:MFS family permease